MANAFDPVPPAMRRELHHLERKACFGVMKRRDYRRHERLMMKADRLQRHSDLRSVGLEPQPVRAFLKDLAALAALSAFLFGFGCMILIP
jgi:hypothetical protein